MGAIHGIASSPATLDQDGGVGLLETQRCDNEEARAAAHLSVVQKHGRGVNPGPANNNRAVELFKCAGGGVCKRRNFDGWHFRTHIH
jgi:hypothetical protein